MRTSWSVVGAVVLSLGLFAGAAGAQESWYGQWAYKVKITNITKGTDLSQGLVFTPILLATHTPKLDVFELGLPASPELAMLAEGGDTEPLSGMLQNAQGIRHVVTTDGPLLPSQSVEVVLPYGGRGIVLSMASMLLPTNDGFIGLDGVALPFFRDQAVSYTVPAYDAGSEVNDELCASIPGPHCGGEGYNPAGGEGNVHVHSGIHGVGDLVPEAYDWRNPVVKIEIRLVRR